ncbi:MAG: sugar phosphate isomerase/epimerase, partial [Bacteroidota bacterium]
PLPQIGLQLWTIREAINQDLPASLAAIAKMGYRGIETAFWPDGVSLQEGAKALQDAGLSVFSIHCELPLDTQKEELFLEMSETYQCDTLVWHGWPEDPRYASMEGLQAIKAEFVQASEFAQKHGKQLGLHNHWWEFRTMEGGQQTAFEFLLERLPEEIFFELDTYWIKVAGQDPAKMVAKWGSRAPFLHVKDGPAVQDKAMTAVGDGVQDFPKMLDQQDHIQWLIVEIDECDTDMMQAVARSADYLNSTGLGRF